MTISTVDAGPRAVSRSAQVHAPAGELFALVADPHRHGELDGSGTVGDAVVGPTRLHTGESFGMKMKMFGLPYKITSKVVDVQENRVVEWRHPAGHHWRWEFESLKPDLTQVTETFDYSHGPAIVAAILGWLGFPKRNGVGIESTLTKMQQRYGGQADPG